MKNKNILLEIFTPFPYNNVYRKIFMDEHMMMKKSKNKNRTVLKYVMKFLTLIL